MADPASPGAPPRGTALPDLAVLTGRASQDLQAWMISEQVAHLAISASEAIGVVGPLVIPGRTACLRCLDLARSDRDPAWPLILAQLSGRRPDSLSCDAPLATAVAAQAAFQALAVIDRAGLADAAANGTLELVLPGWQWRRRTWLPHPRCSCGASEA
jgi:bacteriocin biosynthesis cyclodehydratase domain-containing protein